MSTIARLELIRSAEPTVIFSTPTYAIHLAQTALERGDSLAASSIRCVFVAGEPGGCVPAVRAKIETLYGATVMDHAGATEVGPWGFGTDDGRGLHVIESEFIAEFLEPEGPVGSPAVQTVMPSDSSHWNDSSQSSGLRELVLTSLGRIGAPVIRYRTGDLVRPVLREREFVRLEGGIIGRADDMFVIRGVNIFPTSIDQIVSSFPEIAEYRLSLIKRGAMDEMQLEVEDPLHDPSRIAERFLVQLNVRVEIIEVPLGSLPRTDGKARRIVDRR
jgi:phenylacetate-CoA ligase